MEYFLRNVGQNIKYIRKYRKKIKQKDLSLAVGLNINTISNIESGKFPAKLDSIYKIAKYLDVDVVEFFKFSVIDIRTINCITNLFNRMSQMDNDEIRKFLSQFDT